MAVDDVGLRSALRRVFRFLRTSLRELAGIFGVVLVLVLLATIASVLATAGLASSGSSRSSASSCCRCSLRRGWFGVSSFSTSHSPRSAPTSRSIDTTWEGRCSRPCPTSVSHDQPMMNYDGFLSRAAGHMRSRRSGRWAGCAAQGRDIISFAPGYPAPETFPWTEFQDDLRELLSGKDGTVLQYGPTRGYRPLLEAIGGVMARRGRRREPIDCSSRPDRSRASTSWRACCSTRTTSSSWSCRPTPERSARSGTFRPISSACARKQTASISTSSTTRFARLQPRDDARESSIVVPNFQNPTGLLIGRPKRAALLEWADRRDVLLVEDDPYGDLYFEDSAAEADVRPDQGRRSTAAAWSI